MAADSVERRFERVVGGLDFPMAIVTAAGDPPAGCLVGFHTQAAISPPRYVACVSKRNRTYRAATDARALAVNFLHADAAELAELFGAETGDEVDKFERCRWAPGPGGAPLLAGSAGWIAGAIVATLDAGDHVAFLIEPADAGGELTPAELLRFQAVKDLDPGHEA